jgi:hypothetical protein
MLLSTMDFIRLRGAMVDFFLIGAVKAGTTSMYRYLGQHPAIEMSRANWTRFFHVDGGGPDFDVLSAKHGPALRRESMGRFRLMCHAGVSRSFDSYLDQWDRSQEGMIRGEVAPTYMYDPYACERIRFRFPEARILIILREPVQRAISHFVMDLANNWVPEKDLLAALKREPWRVDEFWWGLRHYLRHGLYSRYLPRILEVFGRDRCRVLLYDDLVSSPDSFMDEVTDFLGVERIAFDLTRRHNQAPISKPALDASALASLHRFFRADVLRTQDIIGRDLGRWLK